ncbi:hypothetical protein ABZW03_15090, partial [Kitasatospora sp. NPDC004799]|uniref:hypothetical protein n=1 Tax=Kitasatospora sp. NPDC004799 TaxID=3154460 RepID=UPI0033A46798
MPGLRTAAGPRRRHRPRGTGRRPRGGRRAERQRIEDVVTIAVGDLPDLLPVPGDAPEDWTAA